jgi:hypothetical protein
MTTGPCNSYRSAPVLLTCLIFDAAMTHETRPDGACRIGVSRAIRLSFASLLGPKGLRSGIAPRFHMGKMPGSCSMSAATASNRRHCSFMQPRREDTVARPFQLPFDGHVFVGEVLAPRGLGLHGARRA